MAALPFIVAAAAVVSLTASGVSAYSQIQTANAAAELQQQQIREAQVQNRIQQNQASIERMKNLQKVLATEEVTFGARNISGASGTVRAFTMNNMADFFADENADKLNYGAKQVALGRQRQMVEQQRKAQVFNSYTGFAKEGASTVMAAYGVPSNSLVDRSANRPGGATATAYGRQARGTNLNA